MLIEGKRHPRHRSRSDDDFRASCLSTNCHLILGSALLTLLAPPVQFNRFGQPVNAAGQ
jgi:hypothetical protein